MNSCRKIWIITMILFSVIGCSVHRDNDNLPDVCISDSLLFTVPLDTLPDGIIDSVRWLPLQNSDLNIIRDISKLSVVDSFIVMSSRHQGIVQVYSTGGKYLYQICDKGNGPQEYLEAATFTVTPTSIYILDNYSHKVSRYSITTGHFVEKTEIPFVAWDMEAFDDNDFLFTCLNNNPEVQVPVCPIDFAVWRTDKDWHITHKYLPVEEGYTELYGKQRYFTKHNDDIVFHALKYDGFFIFSQESNPVFHPIVFPRPLPRDKDLRLKEVNAGQWQFLGETPFVVNGYNLVEISIADQGEQMFSANDSHKIYGNSKTSAKNLPINIAGVMSGRFIGYINDDEMLYENLIKHGFEKGSPEVEAILGKGGCCLIFYYLK